MVDRRNAVLNVVPVTAVRIRCSVAISHVDHAARATAGTVRSRRDSSCWSGLGCVGPGLRTQVRRTPEMPIPR
jgi:hypothetical protein